MKLTSHAARRLAAAAITCIAIVLPTAALASAGSAAVAGSAAATTSSEAPAGAGHPAAVPAGFLPSSASFYSPAAGVVLGGVGCLPGMPCRARLVATTDSGARWRSVKAPSVPVTVVLFASARDGWLYGPTGSQGQRVGGLWATHDRGGHWRELSLGGGVIDSMAASAGTAYAVVTPPGGKPAELFASPAGRNAWAWVRHVTGSTLAVYGRSAWLGGGTSLWATADGAHWHRYPFACPPGYTVKDGGGLASIAAESPSRLWLVCVTDPGAGSQGKDLLRSVNGGRTTHLVQTIPLGGEAAGFAAPPGRPQVITLATEFTLDRTANGGKTWTQDFVAPGGTSWSPVSYLSRNVGWALAVQPGHPLLLRTTDAGATWHQVSIQARSAHPVTAYVVNMGMCDGGHTVTPIDTATNTALRAINVGKGPDAIAVTPNGKTAYVVNGAFPVGTCGGSRLPRTP